MRRAKFSIDFELEADGRWIVDIPSVPGCTVYGRDPMEAFDRALNLAEELMNEEDGKDLIQ
jgi:predicted RNase H-like HicB family nuclease